MHPLMVIVIVVLVLLGMKYISKAPKAQRPKLLLIGGGALLVLLAMTGKLNPLVAALAAAAAAGSRVLGMMQGLSGLQGLGQKFKTATGGGTGDQQSSAVETAWLALSLDHDSGRMSGRILRGRFEGRALSELDEAALGALHVELARADEQSVRLLESYLEREVGANWREYVAAAGGSPGGESQGEQAHASAAMSAREAREVLGVADGAGHDEVVAAHRRLMQKLHPDRGGSDFLAAKVNEAKRTLLDA